MVNTGNRLPGVNRKAKGWITEDMLGAGLDTVPSSYTPPTGAYDDPIMVNGAYLWADDTGVVYVSTTAPEAADDGTIVGTQSGA